MTGLSCTSINYRRPCFFLKSVLLISFKHILAWIKGLGGANLKLKWTRTLKITLLLYNRRWWCIGIQLFTTDDGKRGSRVQGFKKKQKDKNIYNRRRSSRNGVVCWLVVCLCSTVPAVLVFVFIFFVFRTRLPCRSLYSFFTFSFFNFLKKSTFYHSRKSFFGW